MIRIIRYTLAGILGALIAWAVMEPTSLMPDPRPGEVVTIGYAANFLIGLVSGLLIGVSLGIADAFSGLAPRDAVRRISLGALIGAGSGILGISFANAIFSPIESYARSNPTLFSFLMLLFARGVGWAILGSFIGLTQGIATNSTRRMVNGLIGGFIGGAIGGSSFQIMASMNEGSVSNFPTGMIRFVSYSITGGAIGFFIGLIEEMTKKAWLVRLVGRNEGKEYSLYKPVTVLGRSELADIPVYTDPDVAEQHAKITADEFRHYIEDLGSFSGTRVNGQKIARQALKDGDTIEIGKTKFLYRDKRSASLFSYQPSQSSINIPQSQHICPFCGGIRDANGNCDCSVGTQPAQPPFANQQPAQQVGSVTIQQPASDYSQMFTQNQVPTKPQQGITSQLTSVPTSGGRLIAVSGPAVGQVFSLKAGETTIGRESTQDIALSMDNTVSRNHAKVIFEMGAYVLYDTGSTNGTYVNNSRVSRHELKPGDLVQIGSSKFRFEQ